MTLSSVSALALVFSAALAGMPVGASHDVAPQLLTPPPKVETVHDYVVNYFSDIPIMAAIAGCESHFRQYDVSGAAYRGEQNHKDVGVMQINEDYHLNTAQSLGLNIYTTAGNVAYARYLYEQEGTAPWSSSQYCWGKSARTAAAASNKVASTQK